MSKFTPMYGLTGGIASGKSTALQMFQTLGIPTVDADDVARTVIAPGSVGHHALIDAIGPSFFDGEVLNRSKLRDAMYLDETLKRAVEAVVHPRVRAEIDAWRARPSEAPYRILCSPLLLETGQDQSLDGVIVIDVDPEQQLDRAEVRDRRTRAQIQEILAHQLPREERRKRATYIIDNSSSEAALRTQIFALHERLTA